jgi:hypothetical protein
MSKKCKKKSTAKSAIERKMARVKTLQNKRDRLVRQLKISPTDLSARNALMQVLYDLKKGV